MDATMVAGVLAKVSIQKWLRSGEFKWQVEHVTTVTEKVNDPCARFRFCYEEPDTETGETEWQYARWWYVEHDWTDEQVVRAAWLALNVSDEHRRREAFKYDDRMVFNPHATLI